MSLHQIQPEILRWAVATFGTIAADMGERGMRFAEEAIEVAQAAGVTQAELVAVVNRVYARPPGNVRKEIAQAGVTLACIAEAASVDLEGAAAAEFDRIQAIPAIHWKQRHAEKQAQGISRDPVSVDAVSRCVHCSQPATPGEPCRYSAHGHATMRLPAGKTCGQCFFFKRCEALISATAERRECDWFPIRYREARGNA